MGRNSIIILPLPKMFNFNNRESKSESHSDFHEKSQRVMSDSLQPHGLYCPWNSPGQSTGVDDSCSLLQGISPTQGLNPGLPHCRQILYRSSHQGSPITGKQSHKSRKWDSLQNRLELFKNFLNAWKSCFGLKETNKKWQLTETHDLYLVLGTRKIYIWYIKYYWETLNTEYFILFILNLFSMIGTKIV